MTVSPAHISEARLGLFAERGVETLPPTERAHLGDCRHCRRLLEGHRLALAMLSGTWEPYDAVAHGRDVDTLIVPPVPVRRGRQRGERSGFMLPAVAALGLILVGALGALVLTGRPLSDDRDRPALVPPAPSAAILPRATLRPGSPPVMGGMVVRVDAATGAIRDTISIGGEPGIPTEAGGFLWVFNFGDGSITRIDPASSSVAQTIGFDDGATAILGHGDDLWVTADQHDLIRFDGRTGAELDRFALGQDPLFRTRDAGFLAFADGSVWVTVPDLEHPRDPHGLWRVDPESGEVLARLSIDRDPDPPVTLDDVIYAASPTRDTVTRIDPATNHTMSVRVGTEPVGLAQGAGSIWVAHDLDLSIWRLDPVSLLREARIDVGEPVHGVAFGDGRLWATTRTSLHEIDPATNKVVATTRLLKIPDRQGPVGVLALGASVWVGVEGP